MLPSLSLEMGKAYVKTPNVVEIPYGYVLMQPRNLKKGEATCPVYRSSPMIDRNIGVKLAARMKPAKNKLI